MTCNYSTPMLYFFLEYWGLPVFEALIINNQNKGGSMKIKRMIVCAAVFFLMAVLSAGCGLNTTGESPGHTEEKIRVYASIYPVYDFAKNIGVDKIDLMQMTPAGAEPHDWEPSAKLMAEMEKADVFIYNGAGMEPWAEKLTGSINNDRLIVVNASEGIDLLDAEGHEEGHEGEDNHEHSQYDPHVWLDPVNAIKQVGNIKDALKRADEKNKDFYEENYIDFVKRLEALDKKYKDELNQYTYREIVVAHAAFGYLFKRYGLKQVAVRGVNPQEEPGAAKMVEITNLIKEKKIKYIFFETLTNPKLSEVLARESGTKTAVLNPIGGLTEEEIKSGKDYISIMGDNLNALLLELEE